MSNVVCLLNVEADRATFTWSEGPASFEPYALDGMVYKDFKEIAAEAREKLADLVKDYLFDEQAMPKSAFALAEAGYELYQAMFQPGADQARQAKQVRKWLKQLAEQHEVDTLEIVVESPWSLPWNIIYDQEPDKDAFLSGDEKSDRWKPFWGLRYNLAGGRKVDPLRRMPLLNDPKVLMVVDPEIRDGLPEEQQKRLADFTETHTFKMVHSKDDLQDAVKAERPDLLYWLSHASADALVLGGEEISPRNMRKLLRQDDDENFGGLAFLNACQTAEGGESGSFFEAFHNVGFAGMIGTEHQTVDQFANPLGLDFLEAFLVRGEPVGSALRKLRGRVPLGLLYGTYCPPDIRVDRGGAQDNMEIQQVHVAGVALSAGLAADETATRTLPPLPDEPYRSLAYYDREDRALFAGRDDDIERFATYLDDASTRILVLHGESGVGKSSFLRAGVIPYLEEECLGYRFIRDREADESAGTQGSVIFIRATNDLFGQLAQALCEFCARPYEYQTPLGDQVSADLAGVLSEFVGDEVNQGIVRAALRSEPSLLGRIMAGISDRLPFSAILVIDQGEEIFTLTQTPEDQHRGRQALDTLRRTVGAAGNFKVIFSLRTEYYGRVIDRLRRGLHDTGSIREYLLTDFDEDALLEAIRRPTADDPIPYTSDVPFERYGFRYAEGVAEEIASRVVRYTTQRRDSVLPLMQVICAQLYRLALQRADKTISLADLEELGGIEGGMRNHVDGLLSEMLKGRSLDKRPLQKLFTQLYLKQPDGTLTTALLAEDEVRKRWTGRMPFDDLLRSSREMRLLKVNSLRIGMEDEQRYVSLGHDALAKIAADWDEQLSRGARMRKMLAIIGALAAVALVMTFLTAWALREKGEANRQTDIALHEKAKAERQTANASWQIATVARDQNLPVKAGFHFLRAAEARDRAGDQIERRNLERQNIELAAQFATQGLVGAFPHDALVGGVQVSDDESRVLAWSDDGAVKLWDLTKANPPQVWSHDAAVNGAIFTSDESHVLSWSEDGAVKLWEMTNAEPLQEWKHDELVNGAVFRRDDSRVLSWSEDGAVKLWDLTKAESIQDWQHDEAVNGAMFTRDSRVLSWSEDGALKLWDPTNATALQVWKHSGSVNGAIITSDDFRVLSWSSDGAVKLWDLTKAESLREWKHDAGVNGTVLTRGDSRFLAWSEDGAVKLWDLTETDAVQEWEHDDVDGAVFSHDDSQVLTWSKDGVNLWDVTKAEPSEVWRDCKARDDKTVLGAVFSGDGTRVLSWASYALSGGDEPGEVTLWEVMQDKPLHVWKHDKMVLGAAFMRNDSQFLLWSGDANFPTSPGVVELWDAAPAGLLEFWKHDAKVDAAVFANNGSRVLSWSDDGAVKLWNVATREPIHIWKHERIKGAVFASGDSRVLSWSNDGVVKLWDVTKPEPLRVWKDKNVTEAVISSGESAVLSWSDNVLKLWDLTKAKPLRTWDGIRGPVLTSDKSRVLAWSPTESEPGILELWDLTKQEPLQIWRHDEPVLGAVFIRDGSRVLSWGGSGGANGTVNLWDATKSEPLRVWKHRRNVGGAVFSGDGSRVLAWSHDGEVKLFGVEKAEPLKVWKYQSPLLVGIDSGNAVFTRDASRVFAWGHDPFGQAELKLLDVTKAEPIHVWKQDIVGAAITGDGSRVLTRSPDGTVNLWDSALHDPDRTPAERILELEVRSASRLYAAGQLVRLTSDEWVKLVRSTEYAAIQKKKASAADRSGPLDRQR